MILYVVTSAALQAQVNEKKYVVVFEVKREPEADWSQPAGSQLVHLLRYLIWLMKSPKCNNSSIFYGIHISNGVFFCCYFINPSVEKVFL